VAPTKKDAETIKAFQDQSYQIPQHPWWTKVLKKHTKRKVGTHTSTHICTVNYLARWI